MSFYETPARRAYLVLGIGMMVIAVALCAFSFAPDVDGQGRIFCYVAAGFCALMSLFNLWKALRTPPDEFVTESIAHTPIPFQVRYYQKAFWLCVILIPVITAWTAYDLHQLETHAVDRVRLVEPLGTIYERYGYWPTILAVPLFGAIACTIFRYKIRQLTQQDTLPRT